MSVTEHKLSLMQDDTLGRRDGQHGDDCLCIVYLRFADRIDRSGLTTHTVATMCGDGELAWLWRSFPYV